MIRTFITRNHYTPGTTVKALGTRKRIGIIIIINGKGYRPEYPIAYALSKQKRPVFFQIWVFTNSPECAILSL